MTHTISIDDWLDNFRTDYMDSFIKSGGATVKFSVTDDNQEEKLRASLKSQSESLNYLFFEIDAKECSVHMPQEIFFSIAKQIDWRILTRRFILTLLSNRYNTDEIGFFESGLIAEVAKSNDLDPKFLSISWRPMLQNAVTKNRNMVKAFRVAMTHLCLAEDEPKTTGEYSKQSLIDWLTGRDKRIGNIRQFSIRTPINRNTARYFIKALSYWIYQSGYSGMVIYLDNSRILSARNPRDGKKYFSRPATIDHYQLLRDFIDEIDAFSGTALIVRTNYKFLHEESRRSWHIYEALQTRIMDEVRDEKLANPVAGLIRLE